MSQNDNGTENTQSETLQQNSSVIEEREETSEAKDDGTEERPPDKQKSRDTSPISSDVKAPRDVHLITSDKELSNEKVTSTDITDIRTNGLQAHPSQVQNCTSEDVQLSSEIDPLDMNLITSDPEQSNEKVKSTNHIRTDSLQARTAVAKNCTSEDVQLSSEIDPLINKNPDNSVKVYQNVERKLHFGSDQPDSQDPPLAPPRPLLSQMRPIYRLSMRLPQSIFRYGEIPNADKHRHIDKAGYLHKLCGRSFPYLHQWRRRYCVLSKGKLYFYEKDDSKGNDKSSGAIDLKYFDQVIEAPPKDTKKATNVFVVTSHDRSFFDPGRYLLSADTLTEMNEWIQRLRESLEMIKNNNRPLRKEERREAALLKEASKGSSSPGLNPGQSNLNKETSDNTSHGKRPKSEDASAFDQRKAEIHARLLAPKPALGIQAQGTAVTSLRKEESKKARLNESPLKKNEEQQPYSLIDEATPLESITKHRVKGPHGRRAPHNRRTALMKQRASSMSALQQEQDSARQKKWGGGSQEILEACVGEQNDVINTSHPALAYRYSSDEDSEGDQDLLQLDSEGFLGMSAAALNRKTPTPPPRTCSFNIDNNDDRIGEKSSRRNSANLSYQCEKPPMELLDYRSLPRTHEKIASGRSSPTMDALENHLMNQSIQHIASPEQNFSSPESSEVSTFKGSHQHRRCPSPTDNLEEFSNVLIRLSGTLQHMQEHTAALDTRTKSLESEMKDVANLPSSVKEVRKELDHLAESVSFISQEASRARIDLMAQRQEAERIHREAQMALSDAEKTRQEMQKAKKEYEIHIKELHSLITSFKVTLESSPEQISKPEQQKKPVQESDSIKRKTKVEKEKTKKEPETKKSETNSKDKLVGYQSFFQRPSSLIYGLTNRNTGKTSSFGEKDKRDKEKKNSIAVVEESKPKGKNENVDKKKKERKQDDSEKRSKSSNKANEITGQKKESQNQTKSTNTEPVIVKEERPKRMERTPVMLSIDDLPMMDDQNYENPYERSNVTYGISHVSINVSPPISIAQRNFAIEKCPSSPVILEKGNSNVNRPSHMNIPLSTTKEINRSPSSSPSPESPRKKSLTKRMEKKIGKPPKKETNLGESVPDRTTITNARFTRPSNSENRSISRSPGAYAISRQSSSPNIPLQRQGSSSGFPIQRQLSLGTVPEEGTLPRQASLMSVPEDRPIVDQTLPLSPTTSMVSFPLAPSSSGGGALNVRNSMELVAGPIISGSSFQEASLRQIPPASEFHGGEIPLMTSSLKRESGRKKRSLGVVI